MSRRVWGSFVLILMVAAPARAQIPVIDIGNLIQAVLIAQRVEQHYHVLQDEYQTILRMAQGLAGLDRYRIPAVTITSHDPNRWQYGQAWIRALNSGDATGDAYWATTLPLKPPDPPPGGLSDAARQMLEREYATIEITDSVAEMGGSQVGLIHGYQGQLQQAVQGLEDDELNGATKYHEMTAILDKIAAGELLGRRQDMATNQLLSHALEQLLARSKRMRDTEAAAMDMQLVTWRDAPAANNAFVAGTGDALRNWRQP